MAFDRLIQRIDELHNPSVAGLDPRLEYVPQYIRDASFVKYGHTLEAAADAILQFNKALIDALCDVVPAINLKRLTMKCTAGRVSAHWQRLSAMRRARECLS